MSDLLINKDNHAKYNSVTETYDSLWDDAMKANMSVNAYLEEKLGGNSDWGGKYHSWLRGLGIEPETENGWWSIAAIDEDNIRLFIDTWSADYETEDGEMLLDAESNAIRLLNKLSFCGEFKSYYKRASTVLVLLGGSE